AGLLAIAPHGALDVHEAHGVRVEHRTAPEEREAVAGEVHHVDVGGPGGDAFLEDARAFVHQGVHATLDDLLVGDLARRDAQLPASLGDHLVHDGIGDGVALAGLVAVPAGSRLLPEAAHLAELVGDHHAARARILGVVALPHGPADVVAGEVGHAERPHHEPELLHGAIDLLRAGTLLDQPVRLAAVVTQHPVADEAVGHARDHRGLADLLADVHHR